MIRNASASIRRHSKTHSSAHTPEISLLVNFSFSAIFHSFMYLFMYRKCTTEVFPQGQIPKESKPSFVLSTNIYHGPTMSGGVCTETKKTVAALRNHLKGSTWRSPPPGCLPQHPGQDRGEAPPRVPWHWVLHVHDLHPLEHKAGSPCFRSSGRVLNRTHLTASLDKALQ